MNNMNNDQHVIDKIDDYLNDLLSANDAYKVESHCAQCAICKVALTEGQRRQRAVCAMPEVPASENLIRRTEARLDQEYALAKTSWWSRSSGRRRLLAITATIAIMIASTHAYYLTLSASAVDLKLLGQAELLAGTSSSLRVVLRNAQTQLAMVNIPIVVELINAATHESTQLAEFETNQLGTGSPNIALPDWPDGNYELRVTADLFGRNEVAARNIKLKRSWQLMLSTDKPIYQPGQTILVRSLALRRPDLKPVAGQHVEFSIAAPKGNIIQRKRDVTSRFGIASIECPLAQEIVHGRYHITCQIGNTKSEATVAVKDYVLPKFGAEITVNKAYYKPGDMVRGSIQCDYFFGKPATNASVDIDVRTFDVDDRIVEAIHAKTNADGHAEFALRLPATQTGKSQNVGDATVRFDLKVTDNSGQEVTTSQERPVTNHPLRLEVIPESSLVAGVNNNVYLMTTYADGRPAKTRVTITDF